MSALSSNQIGLSHLENEQIINDLKTIVQRGVNNMTEDDLNSSEKTSQAATNLDYLINDLEKLASKQALNHNSFLKIFDRFCPRFPFC